MKITSNINPAGIEFLAAETMKTNGKIPADYKSQMTPAVIKMVERKVKYFKKNRAEYENILANMEKAAAKEAARASESAAEEASRAEAVDAPVEEAPVEEAPTETPAEEIVEIGSAPTTEAISEN